jgi:hypothetical protein
MKPRRMTPRHWGMTPPASQEARRAVAGHEGVRDLPCLERGFARTRAYPAGGVVLFFRYLSYQAMYRS